MTDRPILFSGPMVRALLEGRKTQTRRVLKPQPSTDHFLRFSTLHDGKAIFRNEAHGLRQDVPVRFAPGDRLWVRETLKCPNSADWWYSADDAPVELPRSDPRVPEMIAWAHHKEGATCVSIHMPRWASRLTLTVTDVRVQRVQEISPEDAAAEGVNRRSRKVRQMWLFGANAEEREAIYLRACPWEFEDLWNAINAPRGFGWDANPWVVALTFTVERRNIDGAMP